MKNIKYMFKQLSNKYLLVSLLIVLCCPILIVSYSSFIKTTNNYKSNEMMIGNLLYSMKIDDISTSNVVVPANGEKEIILEITNINAVSSKYKLIYESNPNITVVYAEDENEPTSGPITTTRTFSLLLTNTSNVNVTVNFSIAGGYNHNGVEDVIIPTGYTEVPNTYMKFDYEILSLFVDGVRVEELNENKKYELVSSNCSNDETVTWNKSNNMLSIYPIMEATKCQIYLRSLTITEQILADNTAYADNVSSPYVTSSTGINFANISSNTNGKGLYYTTDASKTENGTRVYYYRGAVENNYLIFSGFCWRIVRIVEDGSIRLVYGGTPVNGVCPQTGTKIGISNSRYNSTYKDNAYVGYMMGMDNECASNTTCEGTIKTTSKLEAQTNTYNSIVKKVMEAWYSGGTTNGSECYDSEWRNCDFTTLGINKLANRSSMIVDTPYCNDRSITDSTYNKGFGVNYTLYAPYSRLNGNNAPTYKCIQNNDKFTVSNTIGNGNLVYPIGMLTADEVVYAGGKINTSNNTYYLYSNQYYWTMSPAAVYNNQLAGVFVVNTSGVMGSSNLEVSIAIRPTISLVPNASVSSGTGTYDNPYIVE